MKERGIIFSGDNPKLILAGSKTQTRRLVKFPLIDRHGTGCEIAGTEINSCLKQGMDICSYGVAGDRPWVREAHYRWGAWHGRRFSSLGYKYKASFPEDRPWRYMIDDPCGKPIIMPSSRTEVGWHKRPSIFMPKLIARITIEILKVRVERLQEITGKDAEAEGMRGYYAESDGRLPRDEYAVLWDSLHGAGSWALNPWVWCLSFRVIKRNRI